MQQIYSYLYRNQLDIFTNYNQSWTQERYRKVYNRNTKIYRNVDNVLDFQFRTGDEKAVNLGNTSVVFNMVGRETQDLILQKDCTAVDASIGRFQLTITETEMRDIEQGSYDFSLVAETRTQVDSTTYEVTSNRALYLDDNFGAIGTIEVAGNITGTVRPSLEITAFKEVNPAAVGEEDPSRYESGIIDGDPLINRAGSTHTFQYYLTNYTGEVKIQGSLDEGASPYNWSDLETVNHAEDTGSYYINITGKYNWLRLVHTPGSGGARATFVISQNINGEYSVGIREDGLGYSVGNVIIIPGDELGGENPSNDLTITVSSVDSQGRITAITTSGTSYSGVRTFVKSGEQRDLGTFDKLLYR